MDPGAAHGAEADDLHLLTNGWDSLNDLSLPGQSLDYLCAPEGLASGWPFFEATSFLGTEGWQVFSHGGDSSLRFEPESIVKDCWVGSQASASSHHDLISGSGSVETLPSIPTPGIQSSNGITPEGQLYIPLLELADTPALDKSNYGESSSWNHSGRSSWSESHGTAPPEQTAADSSHGSQVSIIPLTHPPEAKYVEICALCSCFFSPHTFPGRHLEVHKFCPSLPRRVSDRSG